MTEATLHFVVEGPPVPKGRVQYRVVVPKKGKPFATEYKDRQTAAYEERVALFARVAVAGARWTWTDADRFNVVIRIFREHWDKGGDADNYAKALLDGMNSIAFRDDRYVRGIGVAILDPDPERPRVEIEVRKFALMKRKVAA